MGGVTEEGLFSIAAGGAVLLAKLNAHFRTSYSLPSVELAHMIDCLRRALDGFYDQKAPRVGTLVTLREDCYLGFYLLEL